MITQVRFNGATLQVPPGTLQVYVAETHANANVPTMITAQLMTTELMDAWRILVHDLAGVAGWGRVVAYDMAFPIEPRWSWDLGRMYGPTSPEIMNGAIYFCPSCSGHSSGTSCTNPRCPTNARPKPKG